MKFKFKRVKFPVWLLIAGVVLMLSSNPQLMTGFILRGSIGLALVAVGIGMLLFRRS